MLLVHQLSYVGGVCEHIHRVAIGEGRIEVDQLVLIEEFDGVLMQT